VFLRMAGKSTQIKQLDCAACRPGTRSAATTEPAYDGQRRSHSDVCDVAGYDAAGFFGELLLELKAHVGRAAERVGQLVQDGPAEVCEGPELAALDDDPASAGS
jgi:hypothetical protein